MNAFPIVFVFKVKWGVELLEGRLMSFMNWIATLLYLQLLWMLFTVIGLIIGGFFPATFTVFGVARKYIRGQSDVPMYRTFVDMFKQSLGKANLLGWGVAIVGFSLYYYFNLVKSLPGIASSILIVIIITLALIYIMTALFLIPVYVHFDVKILEVIRHAIIIALSHPFHTFALAITLVGFWYLMYIPALFIFIGLSLLAFAMMFIANLAFNRIEQRVNE